MRNYTLFQFTLKFGKIGHLPIFCFFFFSFYGISTHHETSLKTGVVNMEMYFWYYFIENLGKKDFKFWKMPESWKRGKRKKSKSNGRQRGKWEETRSN
jgi:hypothetical protein